MATPLPLSNIVDVTTTVQASNPGTAAFSVTMIIDGDNVLNTLPGTTPIVPQIREYSSLAEMAADGFHPYNTAYRSAQTIFGQINRPATVKVASFNNALNIQNWLTAVEAADPAWYGLILPSAVNGNGVSADSVTTITEWCDTLAAGLHLFFFDTLQPVDKTTSANLFSTLKGLGTTRAAGFWHEGIIGAYALTFSQAFVASNVISGTLNGEAFTATFATDSNTTMTALAAALEALTCVSSAIVLNAGAGTDDDRTIIVFGVETNQRLVMADLAVAAGTSQPTGTFGLAAQTFKKLTFSAALVTGNTIDISVNGNAAAQATYATSNDATVADVASKIAALDGVGSATVVNAGSNDRSIVLISLATNARLDVTHAVVASGASQATVSVTTLQTQPDYPASSGAVGECIAAAPGTKAWSNRVLALVGADALSTTEYNAILANNGNVYAAFSQQKKATRIGTTAAGLTIRNRILVDALDLAIQNAVFEALQTAQLTPYTDAGIQAIVSVVNGVGQSFVTSGALATFSCSGPKRSQVSPSDVTAGVLNNVTYAATSAGEIQKVNITGTVIV